jgi:Lrp/AsnC family transcriptional regulator for asnA, asnC and gidA
MRHLEALDEEIVRLLEANGRRSNRDIARLTGASEKVVAARLRALLAGGDLRVIAVADPFAVGFDLMLWIGIVVAGRPAMEVAQDLAELPEVLSVILSTGASDIEIEVVAENHHQLSEFVMTRLGRVAGVRQASVSLGLKVFKYATSVGPVLPRHRRLLQLPASSRIDELDHAIIERLWADARATNQEIARRLSISESGVRARIARLIDGNILRITAMRNAQVDPQHLFVFVGIETDGERTNEIGAQLAQLAATGFVGAVLGRYQIFAMALVGDAGELADLIGNRIERMRGVLKVHVAHAVQFVKYDHRWALIARAVPDGLPRRRGRGRGRVR